MYESMLFNLCCFYSNIALTLDNALEPTETFNVFCFRLIVGKCVEQVNTD